MRLFTTLASLPLLLAACGDSTGVGAAGGGGGTTTGIGGSPSVGGGCLQLTNVADFGPASETVFAGTPEPDLGSIDQDQVQLVLTEDATGSNPLTLPSNAADCNAGLVNCFFALEDAPPGEQAAAVVYIASQGTLDLGTTAPPYYVAGSVTGVKLVEIEVDALSGDITEVPGGRCLELASFDFAIVPPADGWTCDPTYYDEVNTGVTEFYCDCECGAGDPDCDEPTAQLSGCFDGQMCTAGACEGIPTDWTCPDDQFDGGVGNGCDCTCGTPDPDCDLGEPVEGCSAGETCGAGLCIPPGWTCDATFYNSGNEDDCDCGCGVHDPDCTTANVIECDYCDDAGSCSVAPCPGTIASTDNATCD